MAIAVFGAFNVLLHVMADGTLLIRRLRRLDVEVPRAGVVALGSSVMEADMDPEVFSRSWIPPGSVGAANAGIGASTAVERYLMARHCVRKARPGTVFVLGFTESELFDGSATAPAAERWWTFIGNLALGFHVEPEVASRWHAGGSAWERMAFTAAARIPVFVERASTWGRVERFRRFLGEVGMPPVESSRFGRVRDFAAGKPEEGAALAAGCRAALADGKAIGDVTRQMLGELREKGFPVVLVSMPVSSERRRRFYGSAAWTDYLSEVQRTASAEHQALFVDASDWVPDGPAHWMDSIHLQPAGAAIFSARLAGLLASHFTPPSP